MRDHYVWVKESVQGEKWHGIAIVFDDLSRRRNLMTIFWQRRVDLANSTAYSHVLSTCKKMQFKSRLIPFFAVASLPISCFIFNFYFPFDFKQPWPNNMVDLQIVVQQHMCTSIRSLLTKRLGSINKMSVNIRKIIILMNEKKLMFFCCTFCWLVKKSNSNQPFHHLLFQSDLQTYEEKTYPALFRWNNCLIVYDQTTMIEAN